MTNEKFGTVVNCIDGRVQEPVAAWLKERYQLKYVDVITEPGPDKILALSPDDIIESIRQRVETSINNHGSRVLAVVGHHDCAGNPASFYEHGEHIKKAISVLRGWDFDVPVLGLWCNEYWQVQLIGQSGV